jgi:hypothetical protein
MKENFYLDYAVTKDFFIIKILVSDTKGPPYETTRTMIPWEVLAAGMLSVEFKKAVKKEPKKTPTKPAAKKKVPAKGKKK